jgi:hypothetical protein
MEEDLWGGQSSWQLAWNSFEMVELGMSIAA